MNKIDKYLLILFAAIAMFVLAMCALFYKFQSTPDTLIVSVFGLAGGECGVLGWIKHVKETSDKKGGGRCDEDGEC